MFTKQFTVTAALLLLTAATVGGSVSSARAQGPEGGPPPGGGQGGPPPGGFGGPGGPGRGRPGSQQMTVANLPLDAMTYYLKLTTDQQAKIKVILDKAAEDKKALGPMLRGGGPGGPGGFGGPGGGGAGGQGGPPPVNEGTPPPPPNDSKDGESGPQPPQGGQGGFGGGQGGGGRRGGGQGGREAFAKIQAIDTKAKQDIEALLTDSQKTALTHLLKDAQNLQSLGIPVGVMGELKLSDSQLTKIDSLGKKTQRDMQAKQDAMRQAFQDGTADPQTAMQEMQAFRKDSHDKAMLLLTPEQKTATEKYIAAHPLPMGGPGGFGGPGGGRPGGGGFGGPGGGGPGGPPPVN